jgi:hypothetical protein
MAEISPLRRRMIEDMTVRNLSPATQRSYVHAVSRFSRYFYCSPDRLGLEDVRSFQVHLVSTGISWPALNQTVCALRFFYGVTLGQGDIPERIAYAREPRKLPVVLDADEVVRFLEAVPSLRTRAALTTAYAAGLQTIAADLRHLGAELGLVAVLHTWGQNLQHHPHVHCVVPGGGPSLDGRRWVACRPGFFLPVRVLSQLFRRLFLDALRAAFDAGDLGFFGDLAGLGEPAAFARHLRQLRRINWVVYAKCRRGLAAS